MYKREYNNDLKNIILDMAQKEIDGYSSQKGVRKYFEGNVDKVINENIKKASLNSNLNNLYVKIIKKGTKEYNIQSISRLIKSEEIFKSKSELFKFARYLNINVNHKTSYNVILRKISSHIYINRNEYSKKYVEYHKNNKEYILEPESIKKDLIESYKSKTRNDMKSIARLLDLKVEDKESAEEIRKKVINFIMKEKLTKK